MKQKYHLIFGFIFIIGIILISGCVQLNKPVCGNGITEEGETRETCCEDIGCLGEQTCQNHHCSEPICGECQYLENHICTYYLCCSDHDCNDNNPNTIDKCLNSGTNQAKCVNTASNAYIDDYGFEELYFKEEGNIKLYSYQYTKDELETFIYSLTDSENNVIYSDNFDYDPEDNILLLNFDLSKLKTGSINLSIKEEHKNIFNKTLFVLGKEDVICESFSSSLNATMNWFFIGANYSQAYFKERINDVLFGENFTDVNGDLWEKGVFSFVPFGENRYKINIFYLVSPFSELYGCELNCDDPLNFYKLIRESCNLSKVDQVIYVGNHGVPSWVGPGMGITGGRGFIQFHFSELGGESFLKAFNGYTLVHELGHSFGDFGDEYISSLPGSIRDSYTINKSYTEIRLNGSYARNIDLVGCPKWCSGELNKTHPCYGNYERVLDCFWDGPVEDEEITEHNLKCYNDNYCDPYGHGAMPIAYYDLGIGCNEGLGCYLGTSISVILTARSTYNSIMTGNHPQAVFGPYNEMLLRQTFDEDGKSTSFCNYHKFEGCP